MSTLEEIQNFKGKFPKQLWPLFFSEMWERFSFYGMRGMLVVFMVSQLNMADDTAQLQYGATQAFVYAFTFIGGLLADKILGFRKSLFWGGILMIVGSLILAINPQQFFFLGISFTIIGTGFFKPNISTMVGTLYKDGDNRRDAGFSMFYSGINVGAMLGGFACVVIGKSYSWNLAFGLAAIVMSISLLTFVFSQKQLGPIGLTPVRMDKDGNPLPANKTREWAVYIGSLVVLPVIMVMVSHTRYTDWFMWMIGPVTLIYILFEMRRYSIVERRRLVAALIFIISSILFWAFFEQSGGSLALFAANNLHHSLLGFNIDPNGVNNSANSLFVILFAPLLGLLWIRMSNSGREPNTVVKFGLSFLFLAMTFFIFYATRFFADDMGQTSLDIFTIAYLAMTFGELCLSPIGLSAMTKLSPKPLQGMMMGMWFLASAYGQYVAGVLGANMSLVDPEASQLQKLNSYADGYYQLAIYALIAGIVLIVASPFIKKMMQGVN